MKVSSLAESWKLYERRGRYVVGSVDTNADVTPGIPGRIRSSVTSLESSVLTASEGIDELGWEWFGKALSSMTAACG